MPADRIAVVGGGIVGASVAYHLGQRTDAQVVVYDRDEIASATTAEATAMIGVAGPDPAYRLKEYGFRLYNEFYRAPRTDVQYRQSGRLRVATSGEGARALERAATDDAGDLESEASGVHPAKFANSLVEYYPGETLDDRFLLPPVETERIAGALYRPQYGYVLDDSRTLGARALALEFVERAREAGVRFVPQTAVTDVHVAEGAVTGIEVESTASADGTAPDAGDVPCDGRVDVDAVVCAAGPWNAEVAAMAGLDLPIDHVVSPVFSFALDEPFPYSLPMLKAHEWGVGIHPKRDDRVLLTYTPDPGEGLAGDGPDEVADDRIETWREAARERAERLLPRLSEATLTDEWVGVGTVTPDGEPIAGRTAVDGLYLAATMAGIQYAPAVGSIVARQLVEEEPTEFGGAVSIARFEGYEDPW